MTVVPFPGSNGAPVLTPEDKCAVIKATMDSRALTNTEKCIIVGLVVNAGADGVVSPQYADLLRYASASQKEKVRVALKALSRLSILANVGERGLASRYNIVPERVIESIVAAHTSWRESRYTTLENRGRPTHENRGMPTHENRGMPPTEIEAPPAPPAAATPASAYKESRGTTESPSEIVNTNQQTARAPARPATEDEVLVGLKNVPVGELMLTDLKRWMVVTDEQVCRNWLTTQISIYGQDVVKLAYHRMKTQMGDGDIMGKPLRVWSKIAETMKREGASSTSSGTPKLTDAERRLKSRVGDKAWDEMQKQKQGGGSK